MGHLTIRTTDKVDLMLDTMRSGTKLSRTSTIEELLEEMADRKQKK